MNVGRSGQWGLAQKIMRTIPSKFGSAMRKAVYQEAQFFRKKMVEGIRDQAPGGQQFKVLSPNTLRVRQLLGFSGTKALIVTGGLRNAIVVVQVGDDAFVGILRTARNKKGEPLANVADIMENGRGPFIVPITDKSRKFLFAASIPPPRMFAVIKIPARPFIRPVFEKYGRPADVRARILGRLGTSLGKSLGA